MLEQQLGYDVVIYSSMKADASANAIHDDARCVKWSLVRLVKILWRARSHSAVVVEYPEPGWLKYAHKALFLRALTTLLIPRSAIGVAYAIEVMPMNDRLRLPQRNVLAGSFLNRVVRLYRWMGARHLSVIASPTAAAHRCLVEDFNLRSNVALGLVEPWFPPASSVPYGERRKSFVFAAEPSARKGWNEMLESWQATGLATSGWHLDCYVPEAPAVPIQVVGVNMHVGYPREAVMNAMSQGHAVVMYSTNTDTWREQIGLALVEGRARGCWLLTTRDAPLWPAIEREQIGVVVGDDRSTWPEAWKSVAAQWPSGPDPYTSDGPMAGLRRNVMTYLGHRGIRHE